MLNVVEAAIVMLPIPLVVLSRASPQECTHVVAPVLEYVTSAGSPRPTDGGSKVMLQVTAAAAEDTPKNANTTKLIPKNKRARPKPLHELLADDAVCC